MTPSNELRRAAEQAENNARRLHAWRRRYVERFGVLPENDPAKKHHRSVWSLYRIKQILRGKDGHTVIPRPVRRPAQHNATVIKMARYRGQYQRANLPTGPEAA